MGVVFARSASLAAQYRGGLRHLLGHPAVRHRPGGRSSWCSPRACSAPSRSRCRSGLPRLNSGGRRGPRRRVPDGQRRRASSRRPAPGPCSPGCSPTSPRAGARRSARGCSSSTPWASACPSSSSASSPCSCRKSGAWMDWVKSVLGILLVALAATYVRDAFPALRAAAASAARCFGRARRSVARRRARRGGRAPRGHSPELRHGSTRRGAQGGRGGAGGRRRPAPALGAERRRGEHGPGVEPALRGRGHGAGSGGRRACPGPRGAQAGA